MPMMNYGIEIFKMTQIKSPKELPFKLKWIETISNIRSEQRKREISRKPLTSPKPVLECK
jgi:hypothetical protein